MANLIRSAKSGSDWTSNDLSAYNIKVVSKKEEEFFGKKLSVLPSKIKKSFLEYDFLGDKEPDEDIEELVEYLCLANRTAGSEESAVDDFAKKMLEDSGYRVKGRIIRTRHRVPFFISGENRIAQTDICITRTSNQELLLLIQEDKTLISQKDPEPQVIAEAIAAFQEINNIRKDYGKDILRSITVPCITMVGTFPRFYLVPVTEELSYSIMTAQYPGQETTVFKYVPTVSRRRSDSMKIPGDRRKILQCFEGFKKFVDDIEKELKG